jgi:hypothetical protein
MGSTRSCEAKSVAVTDGTGRCGRRGRAWDNKGRFGRETSGAMSAVLGGHLQVVYFPAYINFSVLDLESLAMILIYLPLWRDDERVLHPQDFALIDVLLSNQALSFRLVKVSHFDLLAELSNIELPVNFG